MAERKTSRSEDIRQRFRTFFSRSGGTTSPSHTPPPSPAGIVPAALTDELLADMGPGSMLTLIQRVELIQNARDAISSREPINSNTLVKFWSAVSDLFLPEQEAAALDASWGAMIDMLRYQPLKIGSLVEDFGRRLSEYIASTEQDVERKILALNLLTDDGFSVNSYIESIDVVLFQLMQEACKWNSTEQYVRASDFVEKSLRHGGQDWLSPEYRILMLKHVCSTSRCLAASAKPPFSKDLTSCFRLVQALLEEQPPSSPAPTVPAQRPVEAALSEIIHCCCILVGDKHLHSTAWDISKGVLGDPDLCDQALDELCSVITESDDVFAVRGALFHAGMAIWGCDALPTLSSEHNTRRVLTPLCACLARSFDKASPLKPQAAQDLVLDEVLVSLGRLLRKHSDFVCRGEDDQVSAAWRLILQLLSHLVNAFTDRDTSDSLPAQKSRNNLLNLLTTVESLYADGKIPQEFALPLIELFEQCVRIRSDDSIMLWMNIRMEHIAASPEQDQVEQVKKLTDMYFTNESRESVRIQAICLLITHFSRLHSLSLEIQFRLVETVLLPMIDFFPTILEGHSLRVKVIQLFIVCVDELDRIQDREEPRRKSLVVRFCAVMSDILTEGRIESPEVEAVVHEYICIFMRTWQQNNVLTTCVRVFDQLCGLLKKFYFDSPISLRTLKKDEVQRIRELKLKLFSFFLDFRSSSSNLLDHESRAARSPSYLFLLPPGQPTEVPEEPPPPVDERTGFLNFDWIMKMTLHCLRQELDWVVLRLVLEKLSAQLEHWFIVRHFPEIVAKMSSSLCDMIRNRSLCMPAKLYDGPRLQQFHGHVLAPISRLVSFPFVMDKLRQKQLLECLFFGLVSPYNKECFGALTLALLEMPDAIRGLLSPIVLKISQIASNPEISAYVLEFLSTLVYLPKLYVEFTEEQFLSIFAIAVPYTNPFRFNNYIVATAYRVITAWYVQCHQPFRKTFAAFINKGLRSHVMRNFEEHEKAEARLSGLSSADPAPGGLASLESSTSEPRRARGRTMHVIGLNLRKATPRPKVRHSRSPPTASDLNVSATVPLSQPRRPTLGSPPMPRKSCSVSVAPSATVAARLHRELTEVCADMLARFAFSSVATMPRRSHVTERLLDGGPRRSWLVGPAQVVTIATSVDCEPGPNGLCSRCTDLFGSKEDEMMQSQRSRSQPPSLPPFLSPSSPVSFEPAPEDRLCWCSGWAEITIHRPSGITSWMARLQNPQSSVQVAASGIAASSLPLQIAHLYRRAQGGVEGAVGGPPNSPMFHDRLREAQYRELHRQQFSDGAEGDIGGVTIPTRARALGPRVRPWSGSVESLSPLESPADLARSPSLPELSLQEEEEAKPQERRQEQAENQRAEVAEEGRVRSSTVQSIPNEQGRIRDSAAARACRRSSAVRPSYGLNPSFVFLQLYYSHAFGNVDKDILRPIPLTEADHMIAFSLSQLSEVPVYETHCVGVIYVHPGQANDESAIFANQSGSQRYNELLSRLGQPVCLSHSDPHRQYVGDLDTKHGEDGQWTVVWNEELLQLAFHVTTLMPPATSAANKQYKKRHVGNDYVTIVYNDSGEPYKLGTITGQFQFVNIVVAPLPGGFNHVVFITRDNGVADLLGSLHPRVVSDAALGRFLRVCALHANLASLIVTRQRLDPASPFTNCWLERLRRLRRLRTFALRNLPSTGESYRTEICEDFADIVH